MREIREFFDYFVQQLNTIIFLNMLTAKFVPLHVTLLYHSFDLGSLSGFRDLHRLAMLRHILSFNLEGLAHRKVYEWDVRFFGFFFTEEMTETIHLNLNSI